MCVPEALDEDVGELRGGMKAASRVPRSTHSPAPGSLGHIWSVTVSSVASAGMAPLESH